MADRAYRPQRFRLRLTAAFVLVTAISTGALAVFTYVLARNAREANFQRATNNEASVALALAPRTLDESTFQRFLRIYETRSGAATVAVTGGDTFSSTESISAGDIPPGLMDPRSTGLTSQEAQIHGEPYLAYAGTGPNETRYVFVFSLDQLHSGLGELRWALLVSWTLIVATSVAVGSFISRRTLRPVREAADAASAMADGHLDTRLAYSGNDEVSVLAQSFNRMADALQARIDELAQTAERERRFTSDAAHDLRTPLTGLSATAAILDEQRDELPPDVQRVLAVHVRDVERLQALVLDLLELARLDAHAEALEIETLEILPAVGAAIDCLALPEVTSIELDIAPGLETQADRVRFRRIIGNLVTNAVLHGEPPIAIRAHRYGEMLQIDVIDHGAGIPGGLADHVFDRFSKGDDSRHRGGSGLGLAIAREHARAHGGDIVVTSVPTGTCFTLYLPADPPCS